MRRKISLFLILALVLSSLTAPVVRAADEPGAWAKTEVGKAVSAGLIPADMQSGYQKCCTRADFCRLAVKLLEVKYGQTAAAILISNDLSVNTAAFTDTQDETILTANALGIVGGVGGGIFNPEGLLTREQAAAMLMRTAKILNYLPQGTPGSFTDKGGFSPYAVEAIDYVSACGVMSGTAGAFSAKATYTREQAYVTFQRLFSVTPDPAAAPQLLSSTDIYRTCAPAVFYIEAYDMHQTLLGTGSGFFINASGTAVTNYHVISDAFSVKIRLSDGKEYPIDSVLGYDIEKDLAILKVSGSGFHYLPIGDSTKITGGNKIYAIGSPLGLESTISDGIISSTARQINGQTLIQITAALSPGSSGGALLNEYGQVIGVTSSSYIDGQNLNFAVGSAQFAGVSRLASRSLPEVAAEYSVYQYTRFKDACDNNGTLYFMMEAEPNDTPEYADWLDNCCTGLGVSDSGTSDVYRISCNTPGTLYISLGCATENAGNLSLTVKSTAKSTTETTGSLQNGYYAVSQTLEPGEPDICYLSVDTRANKQPTPYTLIAVFIPAACAEDSP